MNVEIKVPTVEELLSVKYGELPNKFKELGVENVWQPGNKKIDMVNEAIAKLKEIKALKNANLTDEEIENKIKKADEAKALALAEEKAAEELAELEKENQIEKEVVEKEYDKDTLENALKMINANLANGIKAQQQILLKKKTVIMDLLEKLKN